jgi:Xaa-Pro aminopeptidase
MVPIGTSIPESIVREHVQRLVDLMRPEDFSAVLVFDASNMLAFTGTPHASWDRLTCGVVTREGAVHVVCPSFERPGVAGCEKIATVHVWREEEDPFAVFARALSGAGVRSGRLGVDGRTWLDSWYRFAAACPSLKLQSAEHLLREVRICKSPAEQKLLKAAHAKGERVYFALRDMIRGGAREIDLQRQLGDKFAAEGLSLDVMIQSGPNGAIPHNPTGQRALAAGDTIVVDNVITWDGYNNDLTRTFAVDDPPKRAKDAYRAVRQAQAAAIAAARPGIECRELDRVARRIITDAGFGECFIHRLGHGMGIECHEPPYLNGANTEALRPGMCVTVEPGVYVRGEFGIRIEDDVLITETGCEVIRGELKTDVSDAFDR